MATQKSTNDAHVAKTIVDLRAFLAIPGVLDALRNEIAVQRDQQTIQSGEICDLRNAVQLTSDRLESVRATTASLTQHVQATNQSLQHIASANERLNETFYRKHIAAPLGASVVDLLELVDRMELQQADIDILHEEFHNLLARFSIEIFAPAPGVDFNPQIMTSVFHRPTDTLIVHNTVRPGIKYRSDRGEQMVLCRAMVSLAEEDNARQKSELSDGPRNEAVQQRLEANTKPMNPSEA